MTEMLLLHVVRRSIMFWTSQYFPYTVRRTRPVQVQHLEVCQAKDEINFLFVCYVNTCLVFGNTQNYAYGTPHYFFALKSSDKRKKKKVLF